MITWILIEELEATGTIALPRFFSRRLLRLGPAYAPALVIPLIGAALLHPSALYDPLCIAPALLTYTYNYQLAMQGPHVDLIVVVWSLCVEEQFYLMWPWLLRTLGLRRGFYFCIFAIAALALYRTALYSWLNWGHLAKPGAASCIRIYFSTDTRIDVIVVGCLFALSLRHESCRRLWAIAGLIAFAAASIHFELIERRFMALRGPEDFRAAIPGRET